LYSEFPEKTAQYLAARLLKDARCIFDRMVMPPLEKPVLRKDRSGLRIRRPEKNVTDASLNDRSGTHRTRLQCHIHVTVRQPPGSELPAGGTNGDHFGVGCGVVVEFAQVMSSRNDRAIMHDDATDGAIADRARPFCLGQSLTHELFVRDRLIHILKYTMC